MVQIGEMEKYLEEHPHDVEAWLSLVDDVGRSFSDEMGVAAAIKSEYRQGEWVGGAVDSEWVRQLTVSGWGS